VLLPLRSRSILTDHRAFYPADIHSALQALPRPRMLVTTPIHLRACLEAAGDLPPVDLIVSATAPLPTPLACDAERRFGAELIEIYGCTEAGSVAMRRTSREDRWTLFSGIGLSSDGEDSLLSAPYLPEPILLQDRIAQDGERHFRLLGRLSDHVNVAGKRASLAALNAALLALPGVEDGVFCLPQSDPSEESAVGRLTAFAVAPGLRPETVLAALRQRIDPAFLPRPLFLVEALPRQENGKLSRGDLEALARTCRSRR
jgi:acyl-coenzyme A synthetase/AMP-(fatty) acid ligase